MNIGDYGVRVSCKAAAPMLPACTPLSIAQDHAVFLAEALANLDEYGRQQRELVRTLYVPF
jgi:hypothetical protein